MCTSLRESEKTLHGCTYNSVPKFEFILETCQILHFRSIAKIRRLLYGLCWELHISCPFGINIYTIISHEVFVFPLICAEFAIFLFPCIPQFHAAFQLLNLPIASFRSLLFSLLLLGKQYLSIIPLLIKQVLLACFLPFYKEPNGID